MVVSVYVNVSPIPEARDFQRLWNWQLGRQKELPRKGIMKRELDNSNNNTQHKEDINDPKPTSLFPRPIFEFESDERAARGE